MEFIKKIIDRIKAFDETQKKIFVLGIACIFTIILIACIVLNWSNTDEKETIADSSDEIVEQESIDVEEEEVTSEPEEDKETEAVAEEDPQNSMAGGMTQENGASVEIKDIVGNANENNQITIGIDVAKYQGTINWKKVADSGIDFVMVRVGYRTLVSGEIVADTNAKYNMQEAQKYGIKVGAYFFSTAVTKEEAIEEANWVADYIRKYKITYPVAYNCEGYETSGNRQYGLSKSQRTDYAIAFLKTIKERGYTPMFYASKNEMQSDAKWETSRIASGYKIWVAQYPSTPYPQTVKSTYSGTHAMWQYTNNGTVPGISKPVDINIAYFGYDKEADAKDDEAPEDATADIEALMKFKEVNEQVTAKEKTNLRNIPSQGSDSTVMYTLTNGEIATRTGISDSGWSRVVFNGKTYYAVSSYLTTDLSKPEPEPEPEEEEPEESQIKTQFTEVNEQVTAKDAVNLRTLPSTTHPDSVVVVKLIHGEVITRTGINADVGWSRVIYNGQVLYCVSSYLEVVTQ